MSDVPGKNSGKIEVQPVDEPGDGQIVYKFVEISVVTEDTIETCVNEWVRKGWQLDNIRFVVGTARRPQMAFVSFVRAPDAAN